MRESNSAAAAVARDKFNARIAHGRASGQRIIEKIMNEVPTDAIIRGSAFSFDGDIDGREPGAPTGIIASHPSPSNLGDHLVPRFAGVHPWALQQMCSRVEMPWSYVQKLMKPENAGWGTPLVAHNLNTHYAHSRNKYLVRSYDNTIRGFLSDRYRRLDSRPLVEAFSVACKNRGAVPIEGYGTETKVALTAVVPKVYEPVDNEPITFGVHWENSDYGNGRHLVNAFIDRAWCANGCIMSLGFAQVHLGKRLDDSLMISDRTHKLDTATACSAIMDVVESSLSEDMITLFCETIKHAHENEIDVTKAIGGLKKQLNKGEVDMIVDKFNSADVVMLPPGNTSWRLSNAISWVAGNEIEDVERRMDLMKIAGAVLMTKQLKQASVIGRR